MNILESTLLQQTTADGGSRHGACSMGSEDSDGEESDCNDHRAPSVKGRPVSPRPPMPGTTVTEGPNPLVAYSNQSELDKQLALEHYPEPLPGSDEVCPGPAGAPAGSLRMMLMMIPPSTVQPKDVNVPRGSVSSWVSVSSAPKRAQHKFDKMSYSTNILGWILCGLCQKLLKKLCVLNFLHMACLEQVAATVTHDQDSAQFWQRINKNHAFRLEPVGLFTLKERKRFQLTQEYSD
uniref:Uncharacterized protein n=1 Tax=Anopheles arabiensis TaxID=7173 RepID=A0A182I5D5_ANOAR